MPHVAGGPMNDFPFVESERIITTNSGQKSKFVYDEETFVYDEENNGTHGTSDFGMESKFAYRK